jgi:hypothetical protein
MYGYYPCDVAFSSYLDVIFCEWSNKGDTAMIENFYVDESGQVTDRFYSETADITGPNFYPCGWWRCNACRQRFTESHGWEAVLDHFQDPEDDDEGENADAWE